MPYNSVNDLPAQVKNVMPEHGQHIFLEAFNHAWEQYKSPAKRRHGAEESQETVAFKVAWQAVKKKYKKNGHQWVEK